MAKRKAVLLVVVCFLALCLTVRTVSQGTSSNQHPPSTKLPDLKRMREMSEAERQRYIANRRARMRLEALRKERASAATAPQRRLKAERWRKQVRERGAEVRKEFLREKAALGATDEQWKLIKPKLERVRQLRDRARSSVNLLLTMSNTAGSARGRNPSAPRWTWMVPWKDKGPSELTETQRAANRLMALVDRNDTRAAQFQRAMTDLRKARREDAGTKRQLAQARKDLRDALTPRQEAALVLMGWLPY
jgi:transposase